MLLIGDVHGNSKAYEELIKGAEESIQVGDLGVGFELAGHESFPDFGSNHRFIRGNHDNPASCKNYKGFLGDWGFLADKGIFYVGGAMSIDARDRLIGISWWADEELAYDEFEKVIENFAKERPEIVVSHDCPMEATQIMTGSNAKKSKTSQALQACFETHQPRLWVYGHYHRSEIFSHRNTAFRCLNILESYQI